MLWTERNRIGKERRYAPSPEKVVPEEADDPRARDNANLFVDRLSHSMDSSEHGPEALIPTVQVIVREYQGVQADGSFKYAPEGLFTLKEAYGAAKRQLLFQKELAEEWGSRGASELAMKNMGDMYILMTAIELALPENQRTSAEGI